MQANAFHNFPVLLVDTCFFLICFRDYFLKASQLSSTDLRLLTTIIFIFIINIWFAIWRLNKYILYGKGFLKARMPPKV